MLWQKHVYISLCLISQHLSHLFPHCFWLCTWKHIFPSCQSLMLSLETPPSGGCWQEHVLEVLMMVYHISQHEENICCFLLFHIPATRASKEFYALLETLSWSVSLETEVCGKEGQRAVLIWTDKLGWAVNWCRHPSWKRLHGRCTHKNNKTSLWVLIKGAFFVGADWCTAAGEVQWMVANALTDEIWPQKAERRT